MTREICGACGRVNPVGFWVPDSIWAESVPPRHVEDTLCLMCFTEYADENGVEWARGIEFFPVSLKTHMEVI